MQYKQEKELKWFQMNNVYSQDFFVIRKPLYVT